MGQISPGTLPPSEAPGPHPTHPDSESGVRPPTPVQPPPRRAQRLHCVAAAARRLRPGRSGATPPGPATELRGRARQPRPGSMIGGGIGPGHRARPARTRCPGRTVGAPGPARLTRGPPRTISDQSPYGYSGPQ
eukprot:309551-Hanusia_phi.AAC.1